MVTSLVFGAGGLGHEVGDMRPPLASPAPTGLACTHRPRLPPCRGGGLTSVLVLGFPEYGLFSLYGLAAFSLFIRKTIRLLLSFSIALHKLPTPSGLAAQVFDSTASFTF